MYSFDAGVIHQQKGLWFMLTFRNQVSSDDHLQNVAPNVTMCSYRHLPKEREGWWGKCSRRWSLWVVIGQAWRRHTSLPLTFYWIELCSHEKPERHAEKYSAAMCLRKKQSGFWRTTSRNTSPSLNSWQVAGLNHTSLKPQLEDSFSIQHSCLSDVLQRALPHRLKLGFGPRNRFTFFCLLAMIVQ